MKESEPKAIVLLLIIAVVVFGCPFSCGCGRIGFEAVSPDAPDGTNTPDGSINPFSCGFATAYNAFGSGTAADPYRICTAEQLNDIGLRSDPTRLSKNYRLEADIDLSGYDAGTFNLIGYRLHETENAFTGTFDGNFKKLTNLVFEDERLSWGSLFPYVIGDGTIDGVGDGQIKNLIIEGFHFKSYSQSGILVGHLRGGSIVNCSVSGTFQGLWAGGAIAAVVQDSVVEGCSAQATVTSRADGGDMGGLVGRMSGKSTVRRSFASGDVSSGFGTGGLVADCGAEGVIVDCYARGNVSGSSNNKGGLLGYNDGCQVIRCYASGSVSVSTGNFIGSFLGRPINGAYTGNLFNLTANPSISQTGVGDFTTYPGITGKTATEMMTRAIYEAEGWDFASVWAIREGIDFPTLVRD